MTTCDTLAVCLQQLHPVWEFEFEWEFYKWLAIALNTLLQHSSLAYKYVYYIDGAVLAWVFYMHMVRRFAAYNNFYTDCSITMIFSQTKVESSLTQPFTDCKIQASIAKSFGHQNQSLLTFN